MPGFMTKFEAQTYAAMRIVIGFLFDHVLHFLGHQFSRTCHRANENSYHFRHHQAPTMISVRPCEDILRPNLDFHDKCTIMHIV